MKKRGRVIGLTAIIITMSISLLVIISWLMHDDFFLSIISGQVRMRFNAALCFVLSSISLLFCNYFKENKFANNIVLVLSITVFLIAFVTLSEYSFNYNIGIDEFFMKDDTIAGDGYYAGRMSPLAAINFLLIGISMFLLQQEKTVILQFYYLFAVFISAFVMLISYNSIIAIPTFLHIPVHGAVCFILLAVGAYYAQPHPKRIITFQRKILIGFTAVFIFLLMIGVISFYYNRKNLDTFYLVEETNKVSNEIERVLSIVKDFEGGNRGYVITGDSSFLSHFTYALGTIPSHLKNLRELTKNNPIQQERVNSLSTLIEKKIAFSYQLIETKNKTGKEAAEQLVATRKGEFYMDNIRRVTEEIKRDELKLLAQKQSKRNLAALNRIYIIFLACIFILLVVIYFITLSNFIKRKKAEEQLRGLLESAPDAIVIVNERGHIALVNRQTELSFGYDRSELINQPVEMLIPVNLRNTNVGRRTLNQAELSLNSIGRGINLHALRKDGIEFPAEINLSTLQTKEDTFIFASVRDITERKQAEEKIKLSEQKFKLLFESNPMPMWIFSFEDDKIIEVNNAATKHYGYTKEEFYNLDMKEFRPPEEYKRFYQEINTVVPAIGSRGVWKHRKKDGSVIDVEVIAQDIVYNDKKVRLVLAHDVTEKLKAENKLRLSEQKYKLLFESVPMPMWMYSLEDSRIIEVNEAAIQHYGYTKEEFLQTSLRLGINEQVKEFFKELQSTPTEVSNRGIWKHKKRDGSIIDAEVIAYDIVYDEKKVRLILAHDVTEKLKAERELKQTNEDLRQLASHLQEIREEERAAMAREVHDELGQQLTGLKMDVSWLSKKLAQENGAVQQKIGSIKELLDGTIKTVRKIATELRPSILDDLGLVEALKWQSQEFKKRAEIKVQFDTSISNTKVDKNAAVNLFRIYQESLTNVARHASATMVFATLHINEDNELILTINDNGKGFNINEIEHKKTLGLLGMKERMLMVGGKYEIISTIGKGTMVIASVPLHIN